MEFVEGESLQKRIQRVGRLDCVEALAIAIQTAEALRHAWNEARLIHRDIKPDNILLARDGTVKVADLGLAKSLQSVATSFTATGTVMGSPHYISPEQARGDKDVDFRSDIYSLGCTLFHMLTGRPPYEADTPMAVMFKHVNEPPPDLREARPECSTRLAAFLKRMMAKDRAKRPSSYEELIAELTVLRQEARQLAIERAVAGTRIEKPVFGNKKTLAWIGGAAAAAVIVLFTSLLLWQPWRAKEKRVGGTSAPRPAAPQQPGRDTEVAPTLPKTTEDAFVKEVAALPAEEQVKRVVAEFKRLNPKFDSARVSYKMEAGQVIELRFSGKNVADLSPVRALRNLKRLDCNGSENETPYSDLSPLRELNLRDLFCSYSRIHDLSPLRGKPLEKLNLTGTLVEDLSPLAGMPLKEIRLPETRVKDLTPLKDARLWTVDIARTEVHDLAPLKRKPTVVLHCYQTQVKDLTPLKGMSLQVLACDAAIAREPHNRACLTNLARLVRINHLSAREFWKQIDAGRLPEPTASGPDFFKEVGALPAEEQVRRVVAKLKERNMDYDGKATYKIENGQVVEFAVRSDALSDISPVRAFAHLRHLTCSGLSLPSGQSAHNEVDSFTPLVGLRLVSLDCSYSKALDLTPLASMPLQRLCIQGTRVEDLTALRGMPLTYLRCEDTPIKDFSPITNCPLREIHCSPNADLRPLRSIKTLEKINGQPAAAFWQNAN